MEPNYLEDVSGNGNHGTLVNVDYVLDRWSPVLDFDGETSFIEAKEPLCLSRNNGE